MRQRLLGHALMGLVSITCVCVGEVPYSLVPLAVFVYVTLPTRSARRPVYMRRFEPVAHEAHAGSFARRRALLREAEDAAGGAERKEQVPMQVLGAGRVGPKAFGETFEETFK